MSRCHAVYTMLLGEPIRVGSLIAESSKSMVTAANVYMGHPFVITRLCEKLQVPTRGRDEIKNPVETL
ncbi:hypothetical protein A2U01_0101699, partial [Trifolium medium]|nr:hypothetical protein [Trifolium medium]